jgi:ABC-type multidrug transport system permease subunit
MNLIQTLSGEEMKVLIDKWDTSATRSEIATVRDMAKEHPPEHVAVQTATLGQQTRILLSRETKNTFRDKQLMGMRFGAAIVLSALFGGVFWQVGKASSLTTSTPIDTQIRSYVGALTFVCINAMFANVQPILLAFPREKPIFIREYSGGSYSASIYFLCKSLIELPLLLLQSAIGTCILYFMMGFSGIYPLFLLGYYLIGLASASIAVMLTSRVSSVKTAMELAPLVFTPQIFFSGIFVTINQIPAVLRWIQYIIPLKYGVNIVYLAELNQSKYLWKDSLFSANNLQTDGLWWYILVLIGLILFFRLIGLISLVSKAKSTVF